jgi:Ca2+/Na+ antiporter
MCPVPWILRASHHALTFTFVLYLTLTLILLFFNNKNSRFNQPTGIVLYFVYNLLIALEGLGGPLGTP